MVSSHGPIATVDFVKLAEPRFVNLLNKNLGRFRHDIKQMPMAVHIIPIHRVMYERTLAFCKSHLKEHFEKERRRLRWENRAAAKVGNLNREERGKRGAAMIGCRNDGFELIGFAAARVVRKIPR